MHEERSAHTATLLPDGKVLVAGGALREGVVFASTEVYDPAADRWTAAAPMSRKRFGHAATLLLRGRVLVTGGSGRWVFAVDTGLASAELYDPAKDAWTPAA